MKNPKCYKCGDIMELHEGDVTCEWCDGSGYIDHYPDEAHTICLECKGHGEVHAEEWICEKCEMRNQDYDT